MTQANIVLIYTGNFWNNINILENLLYYAKMALPFVSIMQTRNERQSTKNQRYAINVQQNSAKFPIVHGFFDLFPSEIPFF